MITKYQTKSLKTTLNYTHIGIEDLKRAILAID